ncbi:MAG TPA: SusC/RagA family TonB-linked outer membrane protein [Puia sp.]|jgi:iron complex outermembrane receptor protein
MTIQRLLSRWVSFTLLCVLFTQNAFSQNKTITGKVTDDKSVPVAGASVTVKGTKNGVNTNADGAFTISVSPTATTLIVSSVGFTQQEITIGSQTDITVSLATSTSNLNEVVVIGYGTARRKDLTGAVATVNAKDFNQGQIAAPDQLLTNKTPGVEITTGSGQPGVAPTIRIRGTNSILNTGNPLVVVDGVELDGRDATPALTLGGSIGFGTVVPSNPLLYINPNDITSIEVLKDASASAIYGSRGASGVIVITTKKASAGALKLDINASWGDNIGYMKKPDLMSASQFRGKLQEFAAQDTALHSYDYGSSVDALKEITQHTISQNYNMSVSSGNENGKWRASFLGSNLNGLIKTTNLAKYIATLSGSYKFFDKHLTIDFGLIVGHTDQQQPLITNTAGSQGQLMQWVLSWNPTQPFFNQDGSFNSPVSKQANPLAALAAYSDKSHATTVLGNISATVDIFKGLSYKFTYALNDGTGTRYTNANGWLDNVQGISGVGVGVIGSANLNSQTVTNVVNYHTDLTDKLRFEALVGQESWTTHYRTQSLQGLGFDINNSQSSIVNILNTSHMTDAATLSTSPANPVDPAVSINSYFARVGFNWDDKYYVNGTFRADGSSKFGSNNRYGYFPSVAARWVISNEDFLKNSAVVTQLAIRGSWGTTGDQGFPAGAAQSQFAFSQNGSIGQTNVPNPNLKWQETKTTDIGLDYAFLGGRLYGALDFYRKNTNQIIDQETSIAPAPFGSVFVNIPANLYNTGVEFNIGASIVRDKAFTWDAAFNISYNKNELKNFKQTDIITGVISGPGLSSTYAQRISNNHPLDVFYLPHYYGEQKGGGDSASTASFFGGDPNPHVQLGFSSTFTYGHFSLNFNLGGTLGYKVYNNSALGITNLYNFARGANTTLSAFTPGASVVNSNIVLSDRYVENGNFLKLRNATLTYKIGDIGQYVKNVSVYFTGSNLFVITKFKGFDPEVNVDKNYNNIPSRSIEYLPYPTPRILSAGVNVSL